MQMPSELASAELGELPERHDQGEQWSQPLEMTWLSPEVCLFILGHAEHGCNRAVKAESKQGQLSGGQHGIVSRQLPSGTQLQTYAHTITLS